MPENTAFQIVNNLRKKVEELAESHREEVAADCFLLLLHHAHRCGYDLMIEAFKKFEINKNSKWGIPDTDGPAPGPPDPPWPKNYHPVG
uniref:Uncharacterized protein n=1 Tax=viral metagenome TaxID=1070528 RepID=A0A6M3JTQ3_9ZZZZ